MKILILTRETSKDGNSIYNSYTQGIRNNYPDAVVVDYFNLYFENAKSKFEASIVETIEQNGIDLIFINFVSADYTFDIDFLHQLSKKCFLMMNFYDSELFFEPVDRYYAQCADLVILPTSTKFLENYSLLGIKAISTLSLFDSKMYEKRERVKDVDVSFVGDLSKKSRKEFIEYLQQNGIDIQVYGKGSENGSLTFDEMIELFNRSKINLNFSDTTTERSFNKNLNTDYSIVPNIMEYTTQLKGRTIEVSLCGSFVLSQDAMGIEELFSSDAIATFQTKEELLEKVKHYLQEETLREEMADRAHKRAPNKFDATVIFKELFENLDITQREEKTIYLDAEFLKNYHSYHSLYLFNFLFKGKFKQFIQECKNIDFLKLKPYSLMQHFLQQLRYRLR